MSDVPRMPAAFKLTGCPVSFRAFIRLPSINDRFAPETHKANVCSSLRSFLFVTGITGSNPLLLIDDKLETSSTFSLFCFCSVVLYVRCSSLRWGFPQPFTLQSLPVQFLASCASDKTFEAQPQFFRFLTSSTLIFLNFSHFHIGCLPSFSAHSRCLLKLSFTAFVADVANVEALAFSW